ncbi:MAG: CDP-alcohol phosphatidyltransferase family protein [Lachnospiraceae bacterium]|nr:CDP-alcohol phosphatidyltransferase family protein [Lachnospiraceae bacterium]
MILGMWNKSVVLTYVGLAFAVLGMCLAMTGGKVSYAYACLIAAGVCDLFDGAVARKVKRTEEEKQFGIELDSLVDVMSFIALPVTIFCAMGYTRVWQIAVYVLYAVSGIARLGYFNVMTADENGPVKYYTGLPVTYAALIFSVGNLCGYIVRADVFEILFSGSIVAVALLEILKVPVVKPKGVAYVFFAVAAVGMLIVYLAVL